LHDGFAHGGTVEGEATGDGLRSRRLPASRLLLRGVAWG
jgi:hypothetical protein